MRLAPMLIPLVLFGCDALEMSGTPDLLPVDPAAARFESVPSGTERPLTGTWGSGPDDVWFAGSGALLRWRGEQVDPAGALHFDGVDAAAIAGSGPDDVWLVGSDRPGVSMPVIRFDGREWTDQREPWFVYGQGRAAWVNGPHDVWTAGVYGNVWHWNGAAWTDRTGDWDNPFFRGAIHGIWAAHPADVWVVGEGSVGPSPQTIGHWDGVSWRYSASPGRLRAIWGGASDDVWAVGADGLIVRWDGAAWARVESGTAHRLMAVRGTGPDSVWAVGDGGTIIHWDGAEWRAIDSGTDANLSDIALVGADVWVVGAGGTILRHTRPRRDRRGE